jgi:hypothetical protein
MKKKEKSMSNNDEYIETITANGTREWRRNGLLDRGNDQPAVIQPDGTKIWYRFGRIHRYHSRPAVERADGTRMWYHLGSNSRENGLPDIVMGDGTQIWTVNNGRHRRAVRPDGTEIWHSAVSGRLDRPIEDGGPAITLPDGTRQWYSQGQRHRHNAPAIIGPNGEEIAWFVRGQQQFPHEQQLQHEEQQQQNILAQFIEYHNGNEEEETDDEINNAEDMHAVQNLYRSRQFPIYFDQTAIVPRWTRAESVVSFDSIQPSELYVRCPLDHVCGYDEYIEAFAGGSLRFMFGQCMMCSLPMDRTVYVNQRGFVDLDRYMLRSSSSQRRR